MKYFYQIIVFSLITFSAYGQSQEAQFEKFGVKFTCPEGWKITEEEKVEEKGYYLTVEKDGFDSSGLVTLTWIEDSLDLEEMIDLFQKELKVNIIYQSTDLKFDQIQKTTFNKLPALAADYKFSLMV